MEDHRNGSKITRTETQASGGSKEGVPLRANRRVGARCYSVRGRLCLCIARLSTGSFGLKCPAIAVSCGLSMAATDKLKLLASGKEADSRSAAVPDAVPATEEDDLPIPSDINTVFLGGLFLLGILAACYVAAEIVLPIVLAFVLSLVLHPAMRALERVHLPRGIAAMLIILVLFGTLGGLGLALSGPAASWAQELPAGIPKLQERLSFLSRPIAAFQKFADQAQGLAQGDQPKAVPVAVQGSALSDRLLTGTRSLAGGLLETVLVLFFLLVSGDTFLRRLVEILPRFKNKRQAVDISQQIERDVSAYLFTITIMNLAVGVATGAVMALCGMSDPVLWGTIAFLLNYIPVLGPMTGVVVFLLAGLLSINSLWVAFLPAGLYLLIHLVEGETVTPMLLARRFTINPVLVILSLVFWYWMWGVPGAILSTPMLAITKIICDRIRPLMAFGHFMEG
jgi:predicted PurR-regulated permease PerM